MTTTPAPDRLSAEEFTESLTGYEEIAIAKHFDDEWTDLAEKRPTTYLRAMVFTHLVRTGQAPKDAKAAVLSMPIRDVNAYFPDDDDEPVPDDPTTAAGKDEPGPGHEPNV